MTASNIDKLINNQVQIGVNTYIDSQSGVTRVKGNVSEANETLGRGLTSLHTIGSLSEFSSVTDGSDIDSITMSGVISENILGQTLQILNDTTTTVLLNLTGSSTTKSISFSMNPQDNGGTGIQWYNSPLKISVTFLDTDSGNNFTIGNLAYTDEYDSSGPEYVTRVEYKTAKALLLPVISTLQTTVGNAGGITFWYNATNHNVTINSTGVYAIMSIKIEKLITKKLIYDAVNNVIKAQDGTWIGLPKNPGSTVKRILGSVNGVLTWTTNSWGEITGTLSNQTDLQNALNLKADKAAMPTKVSQLTNDSNYQSDTQVAASIGSHNTSSSAHSDIRTSITNESSARSSADNNLQSQIDALIAKSDVVDVVGTYAELQTYDTSKLGNNDLVKVLTDETHNDTASYYRWNTTSSSFTYVGSEASSYTKAEADSKYVPLTRTINGKALSTDITLSASDVSALPSTVKYGASLALAANNEDLQLKDQDGNNLGSSISIPASVKIEKGSTTIVEKVNTISLGTGLEGKATGDRSIEVSLAAGAVGPSTKYLVEYVLPTNTNIVPLNMTLPDQNYIDFVVVDGVVLLASQYSLSTDRTYLMLSDTFPQGTGVNVSIYTGTDPVITNTEYNSAWNLFDYKFSDSLQTDVRWVRSETFSWQYGKVTNTDGILIDGPYTAAYTELYDDYTSTTTEAITDSIGGVSITYKVTPKGRRVCLPDQQDALANLYEQTGIAWYYVLDTANYAFKLPRSKWNMVGSRGNPGAYVALNTASGSTGGATEMYLYFFLGNIVINDNLVNAGALSESKANISADNFNAAGKSYLSGIGMPGSKYIDLELGASGSSYTAQANGWFILQIKGDTGQFAALRNTNTEFYVKNSSTSTSATIVTPPLPAKKGEVISVGYNATKGVTSFKFIYAEGEI